MTDLLQFIAVLTSTLFTGAVMYINVVEHPARMKCGTEVAATVFGPSYKRAVPMQVILAQLPPVRDFCPGGLMAGLCGLSGRW